MEGSVSYTSLEISRPRRSAIIEKKEEYIKIGSLGRAPSPFQVVAAPITQISTCLRIPEVPGAPVRRPSSIASEPPALTDDSSLSGVQNCTTDYQVVTLPVQNTGHDLLGSLSHGEDATAEADGLTADVSFFRGERETSRCQTQPGTDEVLLERPEESHNDASAATEDSTLVMKHAQGQAPTSFPSVVQISDSHQSTTGPWRDSPSSPLSATCSTNVDTTCGILPSYPQGNLAKPANTGPSHDSAVQAASSTAMVVASNAVHSSSSSVAQGLIGPLGNPLLLLDGFYIDTKLRPPQADCGFWNSYIRKRLQALLFQDIKLNFFDRRKQRQPVLENDNFSVDFYMGMKVPENILKPTICVFCQWEIRKRKFIQRLRKHEHKEWLEGFGFQLAVIHDPSQRLTSAVGQVHNRRHAVIVGSANIPTEHQQSSQEATDNPPTGAHPKSAHFTQARDVLSTNYSKRGKRSVVTSSPCPASTNNSCRDHSKPQKCRTQPLQTMTSATPTPCNNPSSPRANGGLDKEPESVLKLGIDDTSSAQYHTHTARGLPSSRGAIIGLSVGLSLGVGISVFILYLCWWWRRRQRRRDPADHIGPSLQSLRYDHEMPVRVGNRPSFKRISGRVRPAPWVERPAEPVELPAEPVELPIQSGLLTTTSGNGMIVYATPMEPGQQQSSCGTICSVFQGSAATPYTQTIGGIICVGGELFGLTVAHAFAPFEDTQPQQHNQGLLVDVVRDLYPVGIVHKWLMTTDITKEIIEGSTASTEGKDSLTSDWALVKVRHDLLEPNWFITPDGRERPIENACTDMDSVLGHRVWALTGTNEVYEGTVSPAQSCFTIGLSCFDTITMDLTTDDTLSPGSSGSWIVNECGELCGMIIGSRASTSSAFVLPIGDIFASIAGTLDTTVRVATSHEIDLGAWASVGWDPLEAVSQARDISHPPTVHKLPTTSALIKHRSISTFATDSAHQQSGLYEEDRDPFSFPGWVSYSPRLLQLAGIVVSRPTSPSKATEPATGSTAKPSTKSSSNQRGSWYRRRRTRTYHEPPPSPSSKAVISTVPAELPSPPESVLTNSRLSHPALSSNVGFLPGRYERKLGTVHGITRN